MAITSASASDIPNYSYRYKPSVAYHKKIDLEYKTGFEPKIQDISIVYRYSNTAIDTPQISNSTTIGNYSNTKNTGQNRNIFIENKNIQQIILDSTGFLVNQAMRSGNFNFVTGKLQDSNNGDGPPYQYYKNIIYDNVSGEHTPVFKSSSPNPKPITAIPVGISILPIFIPDTVIPIQCTTSWICIKDI